MKKILLATRNRGKLREIQELLTGLDMRLCSLNDVSIEVEVLEDGATYEENALKKATETAGEAGMITLSDDSGIEVDALNGAPGVHSARFAGEGITDTERNARLIEMLHSTPEQRMGARFVCVAALVDPVAAVRLTFRGECAGRIIREPRGAAGFGYDPIFFLPEHKKTFAELGPKVKNRISHRARAFAQVREYLIYRVLYKNCQLRNFSAQEEIGSPLKWFK